MKLTIILTIILAIFLVFIVGCSRVPDVPSGPIINTTNNVSGINTTNNISGIQDLTLNARDLQQLGLTDDLNEQDLARYGIIGNGTNCQSDGNYANIVDSSLGQHNICIYNISGLINTTVIVELNKFTNLEELNGSYGYSSSHLFGAKGLISENDFGDQSRFHVSDPSDYGGEFNKPNEYYYNLFFTKGLYMIHITSGKDKEAKDYITKIGRLILSKFG